MKPILLLLFLAGIIPAQAQTEGSAKIYGYSEPVSKGVAPQKTIDENGKESTAENKQAFNFFIYLVSQSRVYPSEMWILGKPYSVSIERITKTPVVRKNYNNPSDPTDAASASRMRFSIVYPISNGLLKSPNCLANHSKTTPPLLVGPPEI